MADSNLDGEEVAESSERLVESIVAWRPCKEKKDRSLRDQVKEFVRGLKRDGLLTKDTACQPTGDGVQAIHAAALNGIVQLVEELLVELKKTAGLESYAPLLDAQCAPDDFTCLQLAVLAQNRPLVNRLLHFNESQKTRDEAGSLALLLYQAAYKEENGVAPPLAEEAKKIYEIIVPSPPPPVTAGVGSYLAWPFTWSGNKLASFVLNTRFTDPRPEEESPPTSLKPLPMRPSQEHRAKGSIRVLSLDGGGARGIALVGMLQTLEEKLGQPIQDSFDLICGTSTGGLIAMAIGLRGKSLDDCKALYENLSEEVFRKGVCRVARTLGTRAQYDTTKLSKLYQKEFGGWTLMSNGTPGNPYVCAVSTCLPAEASDRDVPLDPYLFRNYDYPEESSPDLLLSGTSSARIWQAARATSAAPTFFKQFTYPREGVEALQLMDGGLVANNPVMMAMHEASLLWGPKSVGLIVSLGTGKESFEPFNNRGDVLLGSMVASLTAHGKGHKEMLRLRHQLGERVRYYRFDPQFEGDLQLDESDVEKLRSMFEQARNSLLNGKDKENFEQCLKDFEAIAARSS
mmetsp:Transcript_6053/g.18460  ORF Transcript_6053/g.18460 Transcript_6053/m.18460 type:complete len:572 (-) Transcript_6053:130-1845(-)